MARSGSAPSTPSPSIRDDSLRLPKLRAARNREEYALHLAALEWSLDAPITIRDAQDIISSREWAERFDPFAHQVRNLITFCRRAPVMLLADDVGLGKTISAGLILSELMVRRKVGRTLIVAPKLLLPQWHEELAAKFNIPSTTATGAALSDAIGRRVPAVITTYQSIGRYLEQLRHANFDMIMLDEAHKLRNLHGTAKPPKFAQGIRSALADRVFKYVLMLTATPIQNRLWDLYSLIDLLTVARGHRNPLGSSNAFKSTYIEDARAVRIRHGQRENFRRHLSNYIVRTRRREAKLVFPTRVVTTHRVKATLGEVELLRIIGDLFKYSSQKLNGLAQSSIGQALMSSPIALLTQLERMADRGTVPRQVVEEVHGQVEEIRVPGKLNRLLKLVRELAAQRPDDWRLVVFTTRTKTQDVIGKALTEAGVPIGFIRGAQATANERAIRRFRESPPGVRVLVSTDAGAEGVNLQVANVLVNYDLPWNPMVLEQRIGRVQRLASKHAEVTVLNLVLANSVEDKVVGRLSEKLQAISESLGDIEGILESVGTKASDEEAFETIVRRLVVESLMGIDVEKATKKAVESIEEAKQIFDEERDTVERTLGDLKDLHRIGPKVPEITPVEPSIDARDFVLRALQADGASVRAVDGEVLSVSKPGQNPYRITFKDRSYGGEDEMGVFGSMAPRLFIPGKRDFERLSQSWSERSAALIVDRSDPDNDLVEQALREWLADHGAAELVDFDVADREELLAGEIVCRASIANGVDRLEKLVSVPVRQGPGVEIDSASTDEPVSLFTLDAGELGEELERSIGDAVRTEPDLAKFAEFYQERLVEEGKEAKSTATAKQIVEQFSPATAAEAVAASGVRSAVLSVTAKIDIEDEGIFPVDFELIPQRGSISVTCRSDWCICEVSGRSLPEAAVAACAVTGMQVARSLMSPCALTGRLALRSELARCELTGDEVLPSEIETCAVTNRRVRRDSLVESAVSGRRALPAECRRCAFTDVPLLPDEVEISQVSELPYRSDERTISVLTGRSGHQSEFVQSVDPKGPIARDEAAQSAVSGAWAASMVLVPSALQADRRGLPSETVRCAASGVIMLTDEAVRSEVSDAPMDPALVQACEFTGAKALPSEVARSDVSGKIYRLDQQQTSLLSKRSGHSSEFVRSVAPVGWLATDEVEKSAVSGEWGATEMMIASEKPPHRRGLPQEAVQCEVSNQTLLRDETGISAVSGRVVDRSLLVISPASGRTALPEEMVRCEHTGVKLCPDELARCEATHRLVDARALTPSDESGKRGLRDLMVRCAETGRLLLPSEATRCEMTGQTVSRKEAATCAVTGRHAARVRMGSSPATGSVFIDDEQTRSEILRITGVKEPIVQCDWTGFGMLATETAECGLSGLRVTHSLLNSHRELASFRDLLDGDRVDGSQLMSREMVQWLRRSSPVLKSAQDAVTITAPSGAHMVACVRVRAGLLGLGTAFASVTIANGDQHQLLWQSVVLGRRVNGRWEPKEP